ncbi:hypothetical protein BRCH_00366 [Candidatus Burkholderia brachyanthoides]|nr:hypothetical protein BRCH_00366 [Candidatus Burkholderia brachyanthoides]
MQAGSHAANCYLLGGFGEPFYRGPKAPDQIEHNRMVLADLKAIYEASLRDFFLANRQVLDDLTDRLVRDGEIGGAALAEYLRRVKFTDDVKPMFEPHKGEILC